MNWRCRVSHFAMATVHAAAATAPRQLDQSTPPRLAAIRAGKSTSALLAAVPACQQDPHEAAGSVLGVGAGGRRLQSPQGV
jgi:hypothetical protein